MRLNFNIFKFQSPLHINTHIKDNFKSPDRKGHPTAAFCFLFLGFPKMINSNWVKEWMKYLKTPDRLKCWNECICKHQSMKRLLVWVSQTELKVCRMAQEDLHFCHCISLMERTCSHSFGWCYWGWVKRSDENLHHVIVHFLLSERGWTRSLWLLWVGLYREPPVKCAAVEHWHIYTEKTKNIEKWSVSISIDHVCLVNLQSYRLNCIHYTVQ